MPAKSKRHIHLQNCRVLAAAAFSGLPLPSIEAACFVRDVVQPLHDEVESEIVTILDVELSLSCDAIDLAEGKHEQQLKEERSSQTRLSASLALQRVGVSQDTNMSLPGDLGKKKSYDRSSKRTAARVRQGVRSAYAGGGISIIASLARAGAKVSAKLAAKDTEIVITNTPWQERYKTAITELNKLTGANAKRLSKDATARLVLLRVYFLASLPKSSGGQGLAKMESQKLLAAGLQKTTRTARRVIRSFLRTMTVVESRQGAHAKLLNVVNNEAVQAALNAFCVEKKMGTLTAECMMQHLNTVVLKEVFPRMKPTPTVGLTSVKCMLKLIGWSFKTTVRNVQYAAHG
jgi:hypothetical protein